MATLTFYAPNGNALEDALNEVMNTVSTCTIVRETVEMNYSKVVVTVPINEVTKANEILASVY